MANGALSITKPSDLLEKLRHEVAVLTANPSDAYAVLNAVRDAYHLREWVWHYYLRGNRAAQIAVLGRRGGEGDWNNWVKGQFPEFSLVRELCNGSKHFQLNTPGTITATYQGGYDLEPFDTTPFDAPTGFNVVDGGVHRNVNEILVRLLSFWESVFQRQGW